MDLYLRIMEWYGVFYNIDRFSNFKNWVLDFDHEFYSWFLQRSVSSSYYAGVKVHRTRYDFYDK